MPKDKGAVIALDFMAPKGEPMDSPAEEAAEAEEGGSMEDMILDIQSRLDQLRDKCAGM